MTIRTSSSSLRAQAEALTSNVTPMPESHVNRRPERVSDDRAADAFMNIRIVDNNGVEHRIPMNIPLYTGEGRKLENALVARLRAAQETGEELEFHFVGEVVLPGTKPEPVF